MQITARFFVHNIVDRLVKFRKVLYKLRFQSILSSRPIVN